MWSPIDHIVYVVSGKKAWRSSSGEIMASTGGAIYLKKGARIVEQFFDEDFCFILFFITDNFIREIVSDLKRQGVSMVSRRSTEFSEIQINEDTALTSCFHSMDEYFSADTKPHESLIRIKVKELITSLVVSKNNECLSDYLQSVARSRAPDLKETMEQNFRKNLTIGEFSAMCHRSVSSFKRDFKAEFGSPPGRWVIDKRLEYSVALLNGTTKNISEIVFECGFVDLSHFSKSFKKKFGVPPSVFRKKSAA